MRRVLSSIRRGAAVFAVIAVIVVPFSAFADDPQIMPPLPHASSPSTSPNLWQILRVVLFNV
jgi:hypothetical protein